MGADLTVSVVVPVLNGAGTIGDLLTALGSQLGAPQATEVIVVDNGSTDGTQAIVGHFPVTLVTAERRGPSAARNRGLHRACGEVVAYLDADTLPTRRWLAELVAPFADADVNLVGGRILNYLPRTPVERFVAQMPTSRLEYSLFREQLPYVGSGNMAVRRQAALAVGGWDETLYTAEDFDFCIRVLRTLACTIVRQAQAILFSRGRSSKEALKRQAWAHGQGLGQVHLRYPDVVRMSPRRWCDVAWILAVRRSKAWLLPAGHSLGWVSDASAEFAAYHWFWSRWFWGGFFSMVRYDEWRTA